MYSKTGGVAKGLRQGDDKTGSKDSGERTQYRRIQPMYHLALKSKECTVNSSMRLAYFINDRKKTIQNLDFLLTDNVMQRI